MKAKNLIKALIGGTGLLVQSVALADLPTVEDPTRGAGSGIYETLKNYGYDGLMLLALGLCAYAFIKVGYAALEVFGEVKAGKRSWGELGVFIVVGIILIVAVIWLGTKATGIL